MTLSSRERAELRTAAHHLTPAVHVGHQGLTDALTMAIDDALRTRELVKIALAKTTGVPAKDAAQQLADKLGADVVQTIGRTCTLYRKKELVDEQKSGRSAERRSTDRTAVD